MIKLDRMNYDVYNSVRDSVWYTAKDYVWYSSRQVGDSVMDFVSQPINDIILRIEWTLFYD